MPQSLEFWPGVGSGVSPIESGVLSFLTPESESHKKIPGFETHNLSRAIGTGEYILVIVIERRRGIQASTTKTRYNTYTFCDSFVTWQCPRQYLRSSDDLSERLQWLCHDDRSTRCPRSNILQISVTICCQLVGLPQASGYRRRQRSSLCLVLLQVCQESEENCTYNCMFAALIIMHGYCHWPLSSIVECSF